MKTGRKISALILSFFLFVSFANAQKSPAITKVEPPNWWAGLPENPMLLLYGSDLAGAKVATSYPGVSIDRVEPGNPGYLFVWLKVSPGVKPGTAKFSVTGTSGATSFEFPILTRKKSECKTSSPKQRPSAAPSECRFAGLRQDDVMYLIMPDRFANGDTSNDDPATAKGHYDRSLARAYHGGDLKGVQQHLPYIKDLGMTAIWLTPFWKNYSQGNDYHGYGPTDLYAVDEHLGTLRDYQELAAAAHAQGIKVVFDYVVNHIGPKHVWAENPPLATWLHGTPAKHRPFNFQFQYLVDPHASPQQWRDVVEGWFPTEKAEGGLPDLNVDDPHVAKYLLDNAVWWMELGGLDAFRLDTFPYSSRKFWSGWHKELFRIYPTTNTVGEVWNFDPTITSFFEGGRKQWDGIDDELPTMFDFPLYNTIRDVLVRNKPASALPEIMRYDSLYLRPQGLVTFLGNHDTMRFMGENGMTLDKMKAAFGLMMTLRGIPSVYYGDEIAMPGGGDPDNRRDFPGGWPGDAKSAFTEQGRSPEQQEMFTWVQELVRLRQQHPALREGKQWTIETDANHFAYLREKGDDKLLVVFSKTAGEVQLKLADTPMVSTKNLEPYLGAPAAVVENGTAMVEAKVLGVTIYGVR